MNRRLHCKASFYEVVRVARGIFFLVLLHCSDAQITNAPSVAPTNAPPERIEGVQVDLANGFFNREFYDLALAEYEKYIEWFPNGAFVEEAMYRIAECLRGQGKLDTARKQYLALQKAFSKGAFFARAGFRCGEMDWNAGRYQEALKKFSESAETAESSETRLTARFYQARTLIHLNRNNEAIPVLQELGRIEKENPYRGFALLELGKLIEGSGQEDEARVLYARVLDLDISPLLRAEAGANAATLEMKNRHWTAAASLWEKVRKLDVAEEWLAFANLNLVRAYYQNNQYDAVVRVLTDSRSRFPGDAQGELDLLHAHSFRLMKKYKEAIPRYDIFLKNHPDHPSRESATYERLICLYAVKSESWDAEAVSFLKVHPNADGAPQILCWQADRAFCRNDYSAAAASYAKIPIEKLDPKLIQEILYQQGVSLAQTGQNGDATRVFTEFVKRFPDHPLVANTLFQRALSEQQAGQLQAAAASLKEVVERFPKAPERESSLYRLALLQGELKQYPSMRETFQKLTREYPKNKFVVDATYWTGWSFFEEKKYAEAVPFLERARKENPGAYAPQCTSRIILAHYYPGKRLPLLKEVDALPAKSALLAPEIYDWLARQSAKEGDHTVAERYFRKLITHPQASERLQATRWNLAKSLAAQSKWKEAIEVWEAYQKDYPQPAEIVATRLELVRACTAFKDFTKAQEIAEDMLRLQPEGRNNAEARFLLGELMAVQEKHAEAGKYFLSVAVLYDDPEMTPRSLTRAIQSFEAAGETNQVMQLRRELKNKYHEE